MMSVSERLWVIGWTTASDGLCVRADRQWRELTGQSEEAARGLGWLDAVHPDDRAETGAALRAAFARRAAFRKEYRLRGGDGAYLRVLQAGAPHFDENDAFLGYIGSIVQADDVREAKPARADSARFLEIIERTPPALYAADAKGRLTRCCQAAPATSRGAPELEREERGQTQQRRQSAKLQIADVLKENGETDGAEVILERPDGSRFWAEAQLAPLLDEVGKIVGGVNVLVDVTGRKRAEEELRRALRQNEDQLSSMFCVSSVGIAQVDPLSGRLIRVNPTLCEITGYSEAELREMTVDELNHPDDREADRKLYARLALGKRSYKIERRCLRKDGAVVHVLASGSVVRNAKGRPTQAFAIIRDITARRDVEEALRESQETLLRAQRSARAGVWEVDFLRDRVRWSEPYAELFGISKNVAPSYRAWIVCIHPDDRARVNTLFDEAVANRGSISDEFRIVRQGETRWVHSEGYVECDQRGRLIRASGISFDITERKRAEAALRASEEFNRAIIDNSPDCVKVLDLDGRLLMMNEPGRRLMELDDLIPIYGADWSSLWPPSCRNVVDEAVAAARAGSTERFQEFAPTAKGTPKWWDSIVAPIRDDEGRIMRLLSVSRDITDHKRAEHALIESQQRMQLATEATEVGIWERNLNTDELRWNAQMFRIYGIAPTEDGKVDRGVWENCVAPEDLLRQEALLRRHAQEGGIRHREFCIIRKDTRQRRNIHAVETIRRDAQGRTEWLVGTNLDVTDRKRAEAELRASEERFRAVFENAATGIAITDRDGRLGHANAAFCSLLGYSEAELRGMKFSGLVHPEDLAANLAKLADVSGKPSGAFEIENRYVRKDGESVWVRKFISSLEDRGDEASSLLVLVTDMSARRQMEQALREADRRKDEFLATLAHELRNPLAPIRNAVYALNKLGGDERTRLLLAMAQRQVDHLVRLVDDLIEISRVTCGKIELKKERVDLGEVLRHAVETSGPLIDAQGHRLNVKLPPASVMLVADAVRLAQVFANLLNNAAKFTPNGGSLWLEAELCGAEAVVRVRDNGVGIPAETLPSVFELFAQAKDASDRIREGLGIGLALSRDLVQLHDGTIEAFSKGKGKGSEFVVRLPLAANGCAAQSPPLAAGESGLFNQADSGSARARQQSRL